MLPWPWVNRPWPPLQMAERGRLYLWPRNRSFGDSKARPVVVIAPDAATRHGRPGRNWTRARPPPLGLAELSTFFDAEGEAVQG